MIISLCVIGEYDKSFFAMFITTATCNTVLHVHLYMYMYTLCIIITVLEALHYVCFLSDTTTPTITTTILACN